MKYLEHRRSFESMKRFYNWFYRFYGIIERSMKPSILPIIKELFGKDKEDLKKLSAIEYACGTGMLSMILSDYFGRVEGRDASVNMLKKAQEKSENTGKDIIFREGNILSIEEKPRSFDYVFVSFALHLFPEVKVKSILKKLLEVASKKVIIIDHSLEWRPFMALMEWIEGSYYDQFIRLDFRKIANEIGTKTFEQVSEKKYSLLILSGE